MGTRRFSRLTRLTQGVALVGFGVVGAACNKEHGNDTLYVNSVPIPPDAPTTAASASNDQADAAVTLPMGTLRPTMNAPPHFTDDAPDAKATLPMGSQRRPIMNALPQPIPQPPPTNAPKQ